MTVASRRAASARRRSRRGAGAAAGSRSAASRPTPKLRVFLFQLLCVLGQWERALNQLNVASELDAARAARWRRCTARRCAARRSATRSSPASKSPMVFGEPEQWLALLIESLLRRRPRRGRRSPRSCGCARSRRRRPRAATIDGQPFEWIADADSRLGPVLEAIINGRYYWVPFARLTRSRPRSARRSARPRLDAGAPPVRERRRVAGADPDPLSRARRASADGADRAGAQDRWEEIGAGRLPRPRPARSSRPTPATRRCWTSARSSLTPAATRRRPSPRRDHGLSSSLPQERLQPALLDRLTDDEPDKKLEPREQRVMSKTPLRAGGAARSRLAVQRHAARSRHGPGAGCRTRGAR